MQKTNLNITTWAIVLLVLCRVMPVGAQTVSKILGNDGVNVADVVPGNTTPAASKKALVVTISPNSPSPAGSQDVNLIRVGGAVVSLGQNTSVNSIPAVLASDQSPIPVSGTLTPTGTQNVNLTQVGGAAVALGQSLMVSSIPVAIASNQSAIAISGAVVATPASVVNSGNSSTIPLAGGASFIGTTTDVLQYAAVEVFAYSNVSGTLNLEFSIDGTNWDLTIPYTLTAGVALDVPSGPHAQYFRVRYVNGGAAQATFRLQTLLLAVTPAPHSIPLGSVPLSGDDAVLVQAEIVGLSSSGGGTYVPVKVNPSGAVQVGGGVAIYDSTNTNPAQVVNTVPTSGYGLATRPINPTQGSTTSGQTGRLVQGAVTTAAPSYTNAQTSPLSLTTGGALRVEASQATASSLNAQVVGVAAAGAAASGNPVLMGGVDSSGNVRRPLTNTSGQLSTAPATSFRYINASTSTTVKNSAGTLRGFWITAGTSGAGAVLYDCNTAACTTNPIAGFDASTGNQSYLFNIAVSNGITLATTGGTPAQFTVAYD